MTQRTEIAAGEAPRSRDVITLDDIVITNELARRSAREPDHAAECRALATVGRALAASSREILSTLLDISLDLCHAGSGGVSLLETAPDGTQQFRWVALAGKVASFVSRTAPRDFSPCGTCLDRGTPQLYDRPARLFAYLEPAGIVEGLVVPFRAASGDLGTIWIVSHGHGRMFDAEDVRVMTSLADFTAAAFVAKRASEENARLLAEARVARAELATACDRLREADLRKDEFLAMLGHELRNPLGAIVSGASLLQAEAELDGRSPREAQLASVVLRQSRTMSRLLDDLLDVARITQGKIELRVAPVRMASAIESAVAAVRPEMTRRKQRLSVDVEEGICVLGDATRLEQIVSNLLTNAVKYGRDGGETTVTVRAEGDRAVLCVRDDGSGIAPELLPRVFELFAQGATSSDRAQGGLGLGLTLVRRLAELHGGAASIESDGSGCGTTARVSLPLAPETALPERARSSRPLGSQLRVLVVDDNVDGALLAGELVTALGHEATVVHGSEDALREGEAHDWDLVLLDIGLPGMDGHELARRLRSGRAARSMLVALSGYGLATDRAASARAGCDAHIVKPITFEVLQGLLDDVAARASAS
jgi:signal transduction histidine kinase/ActR/RegA family two-component response regulator